MLLLRTSVQQEKMIQRPVDISAGRFFFPELFAGYIFYFMTMGKCDGGRRIDDSP